MFIVRMRSVARGQGNDQTYCMVGVIFPGPSSVKNQSR